MTGSRSRLAAELLHLPDKPAGVVRFAEVMRASRLFTV
jgi:hypothetical protein